MNESRGDGERDVAGGPDAGASCAAGESQRSALAALRDLSRNRERAAALFARLPGNAGLQFGDIEGLEKRARHGIERTPRSKFLIVTADDFGLHESVNEAVELASRAGVLTAASLMVGAPAAADAICRARRLPQLRVGLHLTLADGFATLAHEFIPSITDRSGFMDSRMFINGVRFFARPSVRRQLESEIDAQYAAFGATGLLLDHVNVHKHFHLHPSLLGLLLKIGRNYGLPAVRIPDEPPWCAMRGRSWQSMAGAALLKPWVAWMKRRLRHEGVFCNDAIFGMAATGAMDEPAMLEVLRRLPMGTSEIYLHPATAREHALTPAMRGYRHADELAALLSPRVHEAIAALHIGRGGYQDAKRHRENGAFR